MYVYVYKSSLWYDILPLCYLYSFYYILELLVGYSSSSVYCHLLFQTVIGFFSTLQELNSENVLFLVKQLVVDILQAYKVYIYSLINTLEIVFHNHTNEGGNTYLFSDWPTIT